MRLCPLPGDVIIWTAAKPGPWHPEGVSVVTDAAKGIVACRDVIVTSDEIDVLIPRGDRRRKVRVR